MDRDRFRTSRPKNDWTDWLSDDPPSAAARQQLRQKRVASANRYRPRSAQAAQPAAATPAGKPDVTININLTRFKLPKRPAINIKKPRLPTLPYRRLALVLVVLVVLAGGGILAWRLTRHPASAVAGDYSGRTSPSFIPIAPQNEPQLGRGATNVTSYDGKRDTYSYVDLLPGGHITVSEQPLPANMGDPASAISKIAAQLNATQKIPINNGTAYLATDSKSGSQTIVLTLDNLLIFINSPYGHNAATWQSYINNLRRPS